MRYGWLIAAVGAYLVYDHLSKAAAAPVVAQPTAVPESTVVPPASGARYVQVGQGDTISKISSTYGVTIAEIVALNPVFGPKGGRSLDLIYPGEQIRVA